MNQLILSIMLAISAAITVFIIRDTFSANYDCGWCVKLMIIIPITQIIILVLYNIT